MNATRLGLCGANADEPTIVGGSAGDRDANKERHEGRQKECTHLPPALLSHIEDVSRKSRPRRITPGIETVTLPGKRQA